MSRWPKVVFTEEGMREGMQIEDANISVDDKARLLDSLSDTGIKRIVVGSFVSPKWTPQMARIDDLVQKFHPRPGVIYFALALNQRGIDRAKQYSPPLTIESDPYPRLHCHMCDVFVRRNTNRSQMDEIEQWPKIVAKAQERGVKEAGIGANASWGSNFLGEFPVDVLMTMLERQHTMWDEAGIQVKSCSLGDPMSWCMPHKVEESLYRIKDKWPEINHFKLHFHNARNMAIASVYAALRTLGADNTVELDGSIGGIGGCPYCGNGRATGQAPSEDMLHMLEDMRVPTGVDIDKLIDCVWMAEEIMGKPLYGRVSKAGPRPKGGQLYDINMPMIETMEQARHFKLGPKAYEGGLYPYDKPVTSPYRERVDKGLPAYEKGDGKWPWKEKWLTGSG
jgi:hydroxymethylglutaryl-CoA lyase